MLWVETYNGDYTPTYFVLLMLVPLAAGVTLLISGRSHWRWLFLLLLLPYIFDFGLVLLNNYSLWQGLHRYR